MVTLPDGLWVHEGRVHVVRRDIRRYMADLFPEGGGPAPPHAGYPGTFDGNFPARVVQASGARGRHERVPAMPESLIFFAEVYDSLGRTPEDVADRITQAEDACWEVYEGWLAAFDADRAFHARFTRAEIPEVATGATNRVGREFVDIRSGERLWRLRAEVRLML